MKRLVILVLAISVLNTSAAFAGETLMQSANRHAREAARTAAAAAPAAQNGTPVSAQAAPGLEASGMSGARKALIAIVTGVVVAGAMWTIDHKVEDNTPSSHGLRVDLNK
jgi:hypothetical protein